jgi:hypothetical protein
LPAGDFLDRWGEGTLHTARKPAPAGYLLDSTGSGPVPAGGGGAAPGGHIFYFEDRRLGELFQRNTGLSFFAVAASQNNGFALEDSAEVTIAYALETDIRHRYVLPPVIYF